MPLPSRVVILRTFSWLICCVVYIPASCLRAYDYRHGIDIGIGVGVGVVALGGVAKAMSVDIGGLVSLEDSLFGSLWYAHCVVSEVWITSPPTYLMFGGAKPTKGVAYEVS